MQGKLWYYVSARKTLLRKTGKAIADFDMIRAGDRVAVGVSGGKDSLAMLAALRSLVRKSPVKFTIQAFTIEQGKFANPIEPLGEFMKKIGVKWIYYRDEPSFKLIDEQPEHGCDLCSQYRRRAVYDVANRLGCNVVALGHTADDLCEALLRNALFTGRLSSLPAVTNSRSGDFRLIRPLVYVLEDITRAFAEEEKLPITSCVCSFKTDTVRGKLRSFLGELSQDNPHVMKNLLASMSNVDRDRLLDKRLLLSESDEDDSTDGDILFPVLQDPGPLMDQNHPVSGFCK